MTRTLYVRVATAADRTGLTDDLEAIDAGEEPTPSEAELSVENIETLGRIFRPTNLTLLQAIVEHEPESIRALARAVDRNPPEVLDNINELVNYGLVELEQHGQAKRPVLWYDEIEIDIPLTRLTDSSGDNALLA